jgi:hypothetical protein
LVKVKLQHTFQAVNNRFDILWVLCAGQARGNYGDSRFASRWQDSALPLRMGNINSLSSSIAAVFFAALSGYARYDVGAAAPK